MQRGYFSSGVIAAALILSIFIAWVAILVPSQAAPLARPLCAGAGRKGWRKDSGWLRCSVQ